MKKVRGFVSYRNVITENRYENYYLLRNLVSALEKENPSYEFLFLPPEMIPKGTLFSPYDIAEFILETFRLIDTCDKFIILDKDYFRENGELTSIWTEAEYCIWSYYNRKGFFNKHKAKDAYFTIATPSEAGFALSQIPLYKLTKWQANLLRVCALDFDNSAPHTGQYSLPYMKTLKHLIVMCANCQKVYTVDTKQLRKLHDAEAVCTCGNALKFTIEKKHYICEQTLQSAEPKRINIFDALAQLFEDKPVYEYLQLNYIS